MDKFSHSIQTIKDFRRVIASSMAKMRNGYTTQSAIEELKCILSECVDGPERMNTFLSIYSEQFDHLDTPQRKEVLKVLGIIGEIFGNSLFPFLAKIFSIVNKKSQEQQLHTSIAVSLGIMSHYLFKEPNNEAQFLSMLNLVSEWLRTPNKAQQLCAGTSLTKIIQNLPADLLINVLNEFTEILLELMGTPTIKCQTQLFEALISLVLTVEHEFEPYASKFISVVIEALRNKNWNLRKTAVDVVYTFAAFLPNAIEEDMEELTQILKQLKSDKIKHVREACQETLGKFTEMKESARGVYNESKKSAKAKSIFQGPTNPNFFKAAPKSKIYCMIIIDDVEVMVPLSRPKILNEESKTSSNEKKEVNDINDEEIYVEPIDPQTTNIEDQVESNSEKYDEEKQVINNTYQRNDILPPHSVKDRAKKEIDDLREKEESDENSTRNNKIRENTKEKHSPNKETESQPYIDDKREENNEDSHEDVECYVESIAETSLHSRRVEEYDLEKLKRVMYSINIVATIKTYRKYE